MTPTRPLKTTLLALAVASLSLSACDSNDNRSAGQKLDTAIAKTAQKTDEIKADVKVDAEAARARTEAAATQAGKAVDKAVDKVASQVEQAAGVVSSKVADASITASVNAELAKDSSLSALRINVDTVDGRVVLRGSAPSSLARDRATRLAAAIKGVSAVDNQLDVRG